MADLVLDTCATCRFWAEGSETQPMLGQCRVSHPRNMVIGDDLRTLFPLTLASIWCGEHKFVLQPAEGQEETEVADG